MEPFKKVTGSEHHTNLQKLNLRKNESISGKSLIYLTNLTSLKLEIPKGSKATVFDPLVLEHLPRLNDLDLSVSAPFNHENLLRLTNLTRLAILWLTGEARDGRREGQYGHGVNIVDSELWKRLPKLESYSTNWGIGFYSYCPYISSQHWQTRSQFLHEQELRKKFVEEIKQKDPYCSPMEIDKQWDAYLLEQQHKKRG